MKKKVLSPGLLLVHLYSTSFLKVPKMFDFKSWRREGVSKEEEKGKKKWDKIVENCEMQIPKDKAY